MSEVNRRQVATTEPEVWAQATDEANNGEERNCGADATRNVNYATAPP